MTHAGRKQDKRWPGSRPHRTTAIELYNAGSVAVDLAGWSLDDAEGDSTPYPIPQGTILQPSAFLVFHGRDTSKDRRGWSRAWSTTLTPAGACTLGTHHKPRYYRAGCNVRNIQQGNYPSFWWAPWPRMPV